MAIGPNRATGLGWVALGLALLAVLVGGTAAAWRAGQVGPQLVLLVLFGLLLAGWVLHWGISQRRENRRGVVLDRDGIRAGETFVSWARVDAASVRDVGHGSSTILQVEVLMTPADPASGHDELTSEAARVAAQLGLDLGRRILLPRGLAVGPHRLADLVRVLATTQSTPASHRPPP